MSKGAFTPLTLGLHDQLTFGTFTGKPDNNSVVLNTDAGALVITKEEVGSGQVQFRTTDGESFVKKVESGGQVFVHARPNKLAEIIKHLGLPEDKF